MGCPWGVTNWNPAGKAGKDNGVKGATAWVGSAAVCLVDWDPMVDWDAKVDLAGLDWAKNVTIKVSFWS